MAAASSAVATPGAQRTPTAAGRDPTFAAPHANATRAKAAARMAAAKTAHVCKSTLSIINRGQQLSSELVLHKQHKQQTYINCANSKNSVAITLLVTTA